MLKIENLAEFRSHVAGKEEIRETEMEHGLTSFCYMIAMDETFNDAWSRECRGIVFDGDTVVCRPLPKFFNVNERVDTQVGALDWSRVERVMSKLDGSLISTVRVGDKIRLKSKKSFTSAVALAAERWRSEHPNFEKFIEFVSSNNSTAIFEWTAPDARIVLYYPSAELTLLHVRNNCTGQYWNGQQLRLLAERYGISMVSEPAFSVPKGELGRHLLELSRTATDIEGWVIQFEGGELVKLKTNWYSERHKVFTFLKERDVAELVLSNALDDVKSLLVNEGIDIKEINAIEARVVGDIREIKRKVCSLAPPEDFALPRKDFAIKYKSLSKNYFGLLMTVYLGKQPDYSEYFQKYVLKQSYPPRQLVLLPSVAENEA